MIELKEIEQKLKLQRFANIHKEEDRLIVRCERVVNKLPYQIFYFDYSDSLEQIQDLDGYVETLLADDYYQNPGFLQWNYYLAFLTTRGYDPETVNGIERNTEYARKFVLRYEDFDKWLSTQFEMDSMRLKNTTRKPPVRTKNR
jgi:hypothetical protein